jgi:hypothetical protein
MPLGLATCERDCGKRERTPINCEIISIYNRFSVDSLQIEPYF